MDRFSRLFAETKLYVAKIASRVLAKTEDVVAYMEKIASKVPRVKDAVPITQSILQYFSLAVIPDERVDVTDEMGIDNAEFKDFRAARFQPTLLADFLICRYTQKAIKVRYYC